MPPRNFEPPQAEPGPGIYDGLMFVALSAIITGCIFLALELNKYGWELAQ